MTDALSVGEPHQPGDIPITEGEFRRAFDEGLDETLDIETWTSGADVAGLSDRLEREIAEAQHVHDYTRATIRNRVIPRLRESPFAPPCVGLFRATPTEVEQALRGLLFAGGVEAVDGTNSIIDMLPLTIIQIGVCSTSYTGQRGEWGHRMYRRDLRHTGRDAVDDALALLEARRNRTGYDKSSRRDMFNDLLRRGIMAYAERAILVRKCEAEWRMGQGNPLSYELLTGSGAPGLIGPGVGVMRELILQHKKFVFVPSSKADRWHETLGLSLKPLEYVIIETMEPYLDRVFGGHYRETGPWHEAKVTHLDPFYEEARDKVIVGVYRVSKVGPPRVFYAHRDHAHHAALIAIADSALHEHRGFPMLIDLAHTLCGSMFRSEGLIAQTHLAFSDAGSSLEYATERMTR